MKSQRFTLVELITVIVIIMILMGILLPVVGEVILRAEKQATLSRIRELEIAVAAYDTHYGILPQIAATVSGASEDTSPGNVGDLEIAEASDANEQLMSILMDVTTGPNGLGNRRGLRLLEPIDATNPLSFLDAWGQPFRIKIDTNYDGRIDGGTLPGVGNTATLYKTFAIVSAGSDGDFATDDDNVTSWD